MSRTGTQWLLRILLIGILLQIVGPAAADGSSDRLTIVGSGSAEEALALERVRSAAETGREMVDSAIAVLSQGWEAMSSAERELLNRYYDPASTGEIDQEYVNELVANYRRIRERLDGRLVLELETDSETCQLQRLYYTDLLRLHICPYLLTEHRAERSARQLVHEVTHIALLVLDRPYYHETSSAYAELTPRGSRAAQLPVVGQLIRAIERGDTLNHPDAYARYASEVAEGAEENGQELVAPRLVPPIPTSDSEVVTDMAILRHQHQ